VEAWALPFTVTAEVDMKPLPLMSTSVAAEPKGWWTAGKDVIEGAEF